jgi:transposase
MNATRRSETSPELEKMRLAHDRHLSTIRFEHPAQELAFNEYRLASKEACERVERITAALRVQCEDWRMNPVVKALMCLKGLDFVGSITFVAEMGDLTRFAHPRALMAYLGLVPSEFSSGTSRRLGEITKSGNKHARRILVEAAWNNRFKGLHLGRGAPCESEPLNPSQYLQLSQEHDHSAL